MINEKLGVLLVDVPEPRYWNYYSLCVLEVVSLIHGVVPLTLWLNMPTNAPKKKRKNTHNFGG